MQYDTPEDKALKRAEDKRVATVRVIQNGYTLRTRSGVWYYESVADLFKGLAEYLEQIKKELEQS